MKTRFSRIAVRTFLPATLIALTVLALFHNAPATNAQADITTPTIESVAITSDPDARNDGAYEDTNGQSNVWATSWYGIGDQITATVTFSEPITITGPPVLRLVVGNSYKSAAFDTANGTTATFNYTVVEGDSDNDGITIPGSPLRLSGGTIRDAAANDAILTYDQIPNINNHKVDGIRPRLQDLRIISIWRYNHSADDEVFDVGEELFVHATFSKFVVGSIAGPPQINMQMGDATRPADWEDVLTFNYRSMFNYFVQEGDSDLDGLTIAANAVNLNGGFIKDLVGNDAIIDHAEVTSNWKVDGTTPYVTSIAITSDPGPDNTYGVGDTIGTTVTFSEPVYATKSSKIELDIGGTPRDALSSPDSYIAAYRFGISSPDVVFSYTVQDGDTDTDGITIGANKLTAHDSYIMDAVSDWPGGNHANLEHSALPRNPSHKVTTTGVPVTPTPTPQNSPATGQPEITGTTQATNTLTVSTSAISDADGLNNATFTYQWIRNDGTSDTEIYGATSSTYTLSETDAGKTIKVRVRFADDRGNNEAVTSSPTSTVAAAPNTAATGAPTITGATRIGQTLTAVTTGISDQDGLTQVAYTYQWLRNDGTNDLEISGATKATYELDNNDEGKTIKVKVSFTDDKGHNEVVTSIPTVTITVAPNNPATGKPTITGTPRVNETINANTIGIFDSDGLNEVVYRYQWIRNDGTDDADIIGANYNTYLLTAEDQSKFIKIRVDFNDDAQNGEELTSIATAAVAPRVAFLTRLTISPGTLAPDFNSGITNYAIPNVGNTDEQITIVTTIEAGHTAIFVSAVAAGFRVCSPYNDHCTWYYYDNDRNWVQPISDADTDTVGFQVPLDVGDNYLLIHIPSGTSVDDEFYHFTITRAEPSENEQPTNSPAAGSPSISGTTQVGQTLTASTSGISDSNGLDNVTYSYQWLSSRDTEIDGATESTYMLVNSDAGKTIKVRVDFTDDAGNEETLTSAATAAVADGAPTDPPGSPSNLTGVANSDGTVTLSWDAPDDDSVTGYQILRRRPSEGENTLLVQVNDTENTATEYTDNDVTPDVLYAYRVKAINAVGLSGQSNFVNITPGQPTEPAQNSPATGTPPRSAGRRRWARR